MQETRGYRQFATVIEQTEDGATVHVLGEVDIACSPELESAIDETALMAEDLIVDIHECRYIDSTGLTVLVRAARRYGDRMRVIVATGSPIARIIQITGLQKALTIEYVDSDVAFLAAVPNGPSSSAAASA